MLSMIADVVAEFLHDCGLMLRMWNHSALTNGVIGIYDNDKKIGYVVFKDDHMRLCAYEMLEARRRGRVPSTNIYEWIMIEYCNPELFDIISMELGFA